MNGLFDGVQGARIRTTIFVGIILACVFLGVQTLKGFNDLSGGPQQKNTITVEGYGEAFAAPDIATFTFSVVSLKSTVEAAQTDATAKQNAATKYLKDAGVEDKDIQTSNYSVYPQYDYVQEACSGGYCPGGKQVLRGYEVRQSTTVKVRDLTKAGDLLTGVGEKGATELSGLNFTFDDPNQNKDKAREKAIADAKQKAEELSKQLGVRIVRVISFYENSGGYPVYARDAVYGMGGAEVQSAKAPAPAISTGENTVVSNVSVTYEIR